VKYTNTLLKKEGIVQSVQISPRDTCPDSTKIYDGIIVGWSAYMSIQGRDRRIAFLRKIRNQIHEKSPVLISFFYRDGTERRFKIAVKVGNMFRRTFARDYLEVGDYLDTNYVHYFIREEIESEMQAAGFQLDLYSTDGYGHAVGIAS
jgi:hypothetical protein